MDRNQEYQALLTELDAAPPRLDGTVQRARVRRSRARAGRWCGIPAASLAGIFAAFVLLVNLIPTFALACGSIPFLQKLVAAVAFSPSLSAAVEHDYAQYMGLSETDGAYTMTVEYLIVDQRQVNVFYSLSGLDPATRYDVRPTLRGVNGAAPEEYRLVSFSGAAGDESGWFSIDFDGQVPDRLLLDCALRRETDDGTAQEPLAAFDFDLRLDPTYTAAGETVNVGQWLALDGQRIYVDTVEILPTHVRLNLRDDPDNTAWLRALDFYLEDENGVRYEKNGNGIAATGDPDGTPFYASHRLESSYFGDAEHLTLCVTGVAWLEKERQSVSVDLTTGRPDWLPPQTQLEVARRSGDAVEITVRYEGQPDFVTTSIFAFPWIDPEGGRHEVDRLGATIDNENGDSSVYFTLTDCPWDQVTLPLSYSRVTELTVPVTLSIR